MITIDNIEFNSFKEATRYLQLHASLEGNELTDEEARQLILDEYLDIDYSNSIEADESIEDLLSTEYSELNEDYTNDWDNVESELIFE
tara:strand:+ start:32015 stop:32278 length:264 start_codon:yes stop_codon:yes gene_type:complete